MTEKQELLKQLLMLLKEMTEAKVIEWVTIPLYRGVEFYALTFWRSHKVQLLRQGSSVNIVINNRTIKIEEELYDYGNELGEAIAHCPFSSDEEALKSLLEKR